MSISRSARARREFAMALLALVETRGDAIASGVGALCRAPEQAQHVRATLTLEVNAVLAWLDTLEAAEDKLRAEVGHDAQRRDARDLTAEALAQVLRQARARLSEDASPTELKRLGFDALPPTASVPVALGRYARTALSGLAEVDATYSPMLGASYSCADIRALIEPLVKQLDDAIAALANDTRETQQARAARDQARASYELVAFNAATLLEAFCRQAGMNDAAERVRPTARRISGRADDATQDDATQDDADADV